MSSLPVSKIGASAPSKKPPVSASLPKDAVRSGSSGQEFLSRKFEEIASLVRTSSSADGVAIALRENGQFVCRASDGYAPEPGVYVEPGKGVCGRCVLDSRVLVCQDLDGDIKSTVAAPVIVGDEIEGLIAAFSLRPGAFDSAQIDTVSRMAVEIGELIGVPDTIRLVVPASEGSEPKTSDSERKKQLEILSAVAGPTVSTSTNISGLNAPTLHFPGYADVSDAQPTDAGPRLGEHLSKWDILIIFAAVLIAMVAFSFWLRHHRAEAKKPYTATVSQSIQSQGCFSSHKIALDGPGGESLG